MEWMFDAVVNNLAAILKFFCEQTVYNLISLLVTFGNFGADSLNILNSRMKIHQPIK